MEDIEEFKPGSVLDCLLPPEGHVKYKNYQIISPTNAPIREYCPSGDVNTSPKKNKTVPKYEYFDCCFKNNRQLFKLINVFNHKFSSYLYEILKPLSEHCRCGYMDSCSFCLNLKEDHFFKVNLKNKTHVLHKISKNDGFNFGCTMDEYCEINNLTQTSVTAKSKSASVKDFQKSRNSFFDTVSKLEVNVHRLNGELFEMQKEISEIKENFERENIRVNKIVDEVQQIIIDLEEVQYLDNLIFMLNEEFDKVANKKWPFAIFNGQFTNLII